MELHEATAYFVRNSLWPAVLFTILMMLIGTVGNGLVLVVYRKDYHKSVTWIFIYFLSVLDLCTCLVSMPSELTILFNIMDFSSWTWCKISRYLSYVFHGSSCVILMAIAFNRYDRICRPTSQWLDKSKAKKFCVGILLFASVINIPSLILYGESKLAIAVSDDTARIVSEEDAVRYHMVSLGIKNGTVPSNTSVPQVLIGRLCMIKSEYSESIFTKIFYFIQFLMYAVLVVLVVFFYSKVIGKMVGYRKQQEQRFSLQIPRGKKHSRDESSTSPLHSDDVKSDALYREATDDPLNPSEERPGKESRSPATPSPGDERNNSKNNHGNARKPKTCDDKTRPDIVFQVSDARSVDNDGLSGVSNPVESNKLLSRRIKSVDSLRKSGLPSMGSLVVPSTDVNQNSKAPLFLHASKIHKKRGQYESDRRDDRKCHSDDGILITGMESKDDLYLHKERPLNAGFPSRSVEVLTPNDVDTLDIANKTMTLNRRSPKGSQHCVLPISGLSVKSVTTYDCLDTSREEANEETTRREGESSQNVTPTPENESFQGSNTELKTAFPNDSKSESSLEENNTSESKSRNLDKSDFIKPSYDKNPRRKSQEKGARKKLVQQQSVSFDITDSKNSAESLRQRLTRLDSMSPLCNTPGDFNALPAATRPRGSRGSSLMSPSKKTAAYNRRMSVKPIKALRTSSMLLSISLAFVLSFLPFWIIVLWRSVAGKHFVSSLTSVGFGAVSIFIRSSLISNAVNPVVYGLLNSQFRKRCKAMLCKR